MQQHLVTQSWRYSTSGNSKFHKKLNFIVQPKEGTVICDMSLFSIPLFGATTLFESCCKWCFYVHPNFILKFKLPLKINLWCNNNNFVIYGNMEWFVFITRLAVAGDDLLWEKYCWLLTGWLTSQLNRVCNSDVPRWQECHWNPSKLLHPFKIIVVWFF